MGGSEGRGWGWSRWWGVRSPAFGCGEGEQAMSEMVERVARVLCAKDCCDPDEPEYGFLGGSVSGYAWQGYVPQARAAIAAMREPTIDMQVAGTEQWLCEAAMEERSPANWKAMIDAALGEVP